VNTAGWVLLTAIFGGLLLLVQRTEKKRRNVTLAVMLFVGIIVWGYASYRMSSDCNQMIRIICATNLVRSPAAIIARNTLVLSVISAIVMNILFWILIGRSNPPGTSDSIQVFGMDD
jgi:ABC-type polysaccharide/polyol phosphate export permease